MPNYFRPSQERAYEQATEKSSCFPFQKQLTFDQQNEPEQYQANHKRPANELFILYAFNQVGYGKSDETNGEQVGRPAKQGNKGSTERTKEGNSAKYGKNRKEKERHQQQENAEDTLLVMRLQIAPCITRFIDNS